MSNIACQFSIAKEFTKFPGGRKRDHGKKSGEEFREDYLLPLFEKCDKLEIDLTGAVGYGASFLDESFGELGKIYGLDAVKNKLHLLVEDDPGLERLIWEKIELGAKDKKG
jgi:hypothetical protein